MKKIIALLMVLVMTLGLAACGKDEGAADGKVLKIGVIQLVKHDALDRAYQGFVDELEKQGYVDGENIEIDYQVASNEQANCLTIAESMVNDNKDLIFAIATPAAQAVASKTEDIPILVSAVTDPADSGLIESNENPGRNLSGTSDLTPVAKQIELLKQIVPDAKKIAVLYCSTESNSEIQLRLAKEAAAENDLEVVEASVSSSNEIQQMVSSLDGKVDAIYAYRQYYSGRYRDCVYGGHSGGTSCDMRRIGTCRKRRTCDNFSGLLRPWRKDCPAGRKDSQGRGGHLQDAYRIYRGR